MNTPEPSAHRLTLVKSTGEQDGGDPWIHLRVLTYDNRDLRLLEEEYHTSVTGNHRIARRENAWDAIERRYQRGVYKVNKTTGDDDPRHSFFDNQWRPIEERVDDAVVAHFAWSPFDRWSLIRRKRTVTTPLDETLFLLKDYLDPAAIINASGAVQERFAFDAFGPHRFLDPDFDPAADAFDWNFLFHAEFLDPESGLYNYGFRYYHPDLGRRLSRDPIGESGGLNLYSAVLNDPVNTKDSLGLKGCTAGAYRPGSTESRLKEPWEIPRGAKGKAETALVWIRLMELMSNLASPAITGNAGEAAVGLGTQVTSASAAALGEAGVGHITVISANNRKAKGDVFAYEWEITFEYECCVCIRGKYKWIKQPPLVRLSGVHFDANATFSKLAELMRDVQKEAAANCAQFAPQ